MKPSPTASDPALVPVAPPVAGPAGAAAATAIAAQAVSVAEVLARLRGAITRAFPGPVWVEGEISNCGFPDSGHIYFCLKDPKVTDRSGQHLLIKCAFFRGANQSCRFTLEDGLKVFVLGEVSLYEARGEYQLRVLRCEPQGMGALQLAFEQLKKRLQAEGLFDAKRKRPIPRMPERVGLITSMTGSAIHDMVSKLRGWVRVIVIPARVQGEGAALELARALDQANQLALADVLIIGRGGGSVEDLWAFNEEPVARAIARSRIPVISAVGHEDHWSIADYVADLRASTPTDAARILVREQERFDQQAREAVQHLIDGMQAWLEDQQAGCEQLSARLRLLHPLHQVARWTDRVHRLHQQAVAATRHALDGHERHLRGLAGRLDALSPLAVLARGYSITRVLPDDRVVTDARTLHPGDALETLLARGAVRSAVTGVLERAGPADGPA